MANAKEFWKPIINDFNPVGPASTEDVRKFFVDRNEGNPSRSLVKKLKLSFQNSLGQPKPYKALLTGYIGSGKSTELRRLGEELAEDFLVVWFDAETSLNTETANLFEVLLGMGVAVHFAAQLADLHPPDKLAKNLVKSLSKFVRTYEERKGFSLKLEDLINQIGASVLVAGAGVVGGPILAGTVAAGAFAASKLELNVKDDLVKTLELPPNRKEVIGALNAIINFAQRECKRPMLIITDGLDKVSAARAQQMFAASALLTEPSCALIYAAPIEFYHRLEAGQAINLFNEYKMLPNPPVHYRPPIGDDWKAERQPNEDGLKVMRKVVTRRLEARGLSADDIIKPEALALLARMSGGVMRELIRYFHNAATNAQLMEQSQIDEAIADEVIKEHRQEIDARLKLYHRKALTGILRNGALNGGQDESSEDELLRSLHLLSYQSDSGFWFDAHPNVFPLL